MKLPPRWAVHVTLVLLPFGVGLSFFLNELKGADLPPSVTVAIGIVIGLVLSALLVALLARQARLLELARTGERSAIALAARDPHIDVITRFHLLLSGGDVESAQLVLDTQLRKVVPGTTRIVAMADAAVALARRGHAAAEAAIDAITLDQPLIRLRTPLVLAQQRLHARLLAMAATLAPSPAAGARALAKLERERDPEIDAYAAWIRAHLDAPLDPRETDRASERGAELAAHAGYPTAADASRQRAVRIRALATANVYR